MYRSDGFLTFALFLVFILIFVCNFVFMYVYLYRVDGSVCMQFCDFVCIG